MNMRKQKKIQSAACLSSSRYVTPTQDHPPYNIAAWHNYLPWRINLPVALCTYLTAYLFQLESPAQQIHSMLPSVEKSHIPHINTYYPTKASTKNFTGHFPIRVLTVVSDSYVLINSSICTFSHTQLPVFGVITPWDKRSLYSIAVDSFSLPYLTWSICLASHEVKKSNQIQQHAHD